jgi:hypothetical protein
VTRRPRPALPARLWQTARMHAIDDLGSVRDGGEPGPAPAALAAMATR